MTIAWWAFDELANVPRGPHYKGEKTCEGSALATDQ
jgi:hypothetical protein